MQDAPSSTGVLHSHRAVPDLLSWVQCFSVYTAVVASAFPERVHELLPYQTLIICEIRRCGRKGWLAYDSFSSSRWRENGKGRRGVGSTRTSSRPPFWHWGLSVAELQPLPGVRSPGGLHSGQRKGECQQCTPQLKAHSYREQMREGVQRGSRGKAPCSTICFSWNQKDCSFPYHRYLHVCVQCGGDHKILRCHMVGSSERLHRRERDAKRVREVGQAKSS